MIMMVVKVAAAAAAVAAVVGTVMSEPKIMMSILVLYELSWYVLE